MKIGDKVIRTCLGGRGDRGEIVSLTIASDVFKVKVKHTGIIQEWHKLHFKVDEIPEYKPETKLLRSSVPMVGDRVTHTAHGHGQLVGTIASNSSLMDEDRWNMMYDSGKTGTWLKKYCVHYDIAKDVTLTGKKKAYKADNAITLPEAERYAMYIMENLVNPPIMADEWQNNFFINPNKSEEDIMKLTIQDYTTVNGVKSDAINTDGYIKLISDAEAEVARLEKLQSGSKAIANSSVITTNIKELKAGIERCVTMMDKNAG